MAPVTGFELPFHVACCISAAFYFAAAVYLLFRILAQRMAVLATYSCLLFALATTNVLLYASYDASFSHIYSFFLVSALCALVGASDRLFLRSVAFGLLLGLAVIVRPTNIIAAMLWLQLTKDCYREQVIKSMAVVCCGAVLAASPQMLIWLATSGSLIHYSYGNEGFKACACLRSGWSGGPCHLVIQNHGPGPIKLAAQNGDFQIFGYPQAIGVIAATAIQIFCFGTVAIIGGFVLISRSSITVWRAHKSVPPAGS